MYPTLLKLSRKIQSELKYSWWVALLALFCLTLYEQGLRKKDKDYLLLSKQLSYLQSEKAEALKKRMDLQNQISSQQDPDWIELTLMKRFGMVPDGYQKVFFE